jgi:hypothetical protein
VLPAAGLLSQIIDVCVGSVVVVPPEIARLDKTLDHPGMLPVYPESKMYVVKVDEFTDQVLFSTIQPLMFVPAVADNGILVASNVDVHLSTPSSNVPAVVPSHE